MDREQNFMRRDCPKLTTNGHTVHGEVNVAEMKCGMKLQFSTSRVHFDTKQLSCQVQSVELSGVSVSVLLFQPFFGPLGVTR